MYRSNKTNSLRLVYMSATVCALCVTVMIIALCLPQKAQMGEFVPPPFEENAVYGAPCAEGGAPILPVKSDSICFSAHICGEFSVSDGTAEVWFANDAENTVWLKLRVYGADGSILGETGLLKPGEYVKSVSLSKLPENGERITYKLMSYEPETYYSMGAITLHTTARLDG